MDKGAAKKILGRSPHDRKIPHGVFTQPVVFSAIRHSRFRYLILSALSYFETFRLYLFGSQIAEPDEVLLAWAENSQDR